MKKFIVSALLISFSVNANSDTCSYENVNAALRVIEKCSVTHIATICANNVAKANPIRGCGTFIEGCYDICTSKNYIPSICADACSGNL